MFKSLIIQLELSNYLFLVSPSKKHLNMVKVKTAKNFFAILANVSLLINSFLPFLLAAKPAYAQIPEVVVSTIKYNQSANKLNISTNSSEKIAYQLFYKTADKIDVIAGDDLSKSNFYLGTCSANSCLPQNISRGILKTETGLNQFNSQFFTLENNILTIIKESKSLQSDLTDEENEFLKNVSQWTFEKVELNKEYVSPENNGVKLTFTKLPVNSGNIRIEEITLTPEQIKQTGSLSDKAYDITSDMTDGTFAYNLSLPIPIPSKGTNVDIKFAEDISELNSAQKVDATIINSTNTSVSVKNLDHFTIYIVSQTIDSSDESSRIINVLENNKLSSSDDNRLELDDHWTGGTYKDNEYVEFHFTQNLTNITQLTSSVNLIFEYQRDDIEPVSYVYYYKARLQIFNYSNGNWESLSDDLRILTGNLQNEKTFNIPIPNKYIDTVEKINNLKIRFQSTGLKWGTLRGIETYYDYVALNYNIDTTAPTISNTPSNITAEADSSSGSIVTWTSPTATDDVDETVDVNCTPASGSTFSMGTTTVTCNAQDSVGNTATPTSFTVIVQDNTPPTITLNGEAEITLEAGTTYSEPGATVTDNVDTGLTTTITGSVDTSTVGTYILNYNAVDSNNNHADQVTRTIYVVDTTPPAIPTLTSPIGFTNDNTPLMQWDDVDEAVGYYYLVKYNCTDISDSNTCSSIYPNSNGLWQTSSEYQAGKTNDGVYYWQVKACDASNNCSEWSDYSKITIDTTAPVVTVNPFITNDKTPKISGTVNDVTASITIKVAGVDYNPNNNNGNWEIDSLSALADGTYDVIASATDTAGNKGTDLTTDELTVDSIAPTATFTHYIDGVEFNGSIAYVKNLNQLTFNGEYKDASPSSGLLKDSYSIFDAQEDGSFHFMNNGAKSYCSWRTEPNLVNLSGDYSLVSGEAFTNCISDLPDDEYYMSHQVYDNAARGTDTAITQFRDVLGLHFVIDKTPPIVKITSPTVDVTNSNIKINGTVIDNNPHHYWLVIQDSNNTTIAGPGTVSNTTSFTDKELFNWDITSVPDGVYTIILAARDAAGNKDDSTSVSTKKITVDKSDPTSTITSPSNIGSSSLIYSNSWDGNITGAATDSLSGVKEIKLTIQNIYNEYWNGSAWQIEEALVNTTGINGSSFCPQTYKCDLDAETLLNISGEKIEATSEQVDNCDVNKDGKISSIDALVILQKTNKILCITNDWTYQIGSTLTEGTYTIKSHAIDNAGNMENTYTVTIILDKTIPEVNISINPTEGDASNGWYKTQPEVTLIATDNILTDKVEYQWDSKTGIWTTYSTPFKLTNEGAHVLYYRSIDKASNISDVGAKNIKWDQTDLENGPQNISANPNPTSGSTSKIKWEAAKDNNGINKYEIQWKLNDSNPLISYSKTVDSNTFEVEIDQLTEGRWTVKVIAFDQSGKTKDNSIDLNVDRTAPVAPTLQLTNTGTGTATLSWNAITDAKDYIIWYGSVQGIHQFGARVGNVTSYTVKGLGAGNYYFIVKAVDEAQNQSVDSNEVNTGTITGAPGTTPGQPAEGFSPEVLGETTEDVSTPNIDPSLNNEINNEINNETGDVLGNTTQKGFNWWWLSLLLIIPIYPIGRIIFKKKKQTF